MGKGHKDVVNALLEAKAAVDTPLRDGRTALMLAVDAGNTDIAKSLLDAGAVVNARDPDGKTALMLGAAGGHEVGRHLLLPHQHVCVGPVR